MRVSSMVGLLAMLWSYIVLGATQGPDSEPPCNELCVVTSLASNITYENEFAHECINTKRQGSEALPLHCCPNLNETSRWQEGQNVMSHCSTLPLYTPVALFFQKTYVFSFAGIYVGCLTDGNVGFKLIRQRCEQYPELIHITINGTTHRDHPFQYYAIV